jgi:hypothetical protein
LEAKKMPTLVEDVSSQAEGGNRAEQEMEEEGGEEGGMEVEGGGADVERGMQEEAGYGEVSNADLLHHLQPQHEDPSQSHAEVEVGEDLEDVRQGVEGGEMEGAEGGDDDEQLQISRTQDESQQHDAEDAGEAGEGEEEQADTAGGGVLVEELEDDEEVETENQHEIAVEEPDEQRGEEEEASHDSSRHESPQDE